MCLDKLTLCLLGNFHAFLLSVEFLLENHLVKKKPFRKTISVKQFHLDHALHMHMGLLIKVITFRR